MKTVVTLSAYARRCRPRPSPRMVELRARGLGFGRIARTIGCARITVSRYLRSFEEESR